MVFISRFTHKSELDEDSTLQLLLFLSMQGLLVQVLVALNRPVHHAYIKVSRRKHKHQC